LNGFGSGELVGETGQGAMNTAVRKPAFDQMGQFPVVAEGEIDLGAVLGPDVMQVGRLAARVLPEMDMFQQHRGHRIFEANSAVATDQTGIEEIDLGRLQNGPSHIVAPGLHGEDDVQRLQNLEVALQRGW